MSFNFKKHPVSCTRNKQLCNRHTLNPLKWRILEWCSAITLPAVSFEFHCNVCLYVSSSFSVVFPSMGRSLLPVLMSSTWSLVSCAKDFSSTAPTAMRLKLKSPRNLDNLERFVCIKCFAMAMCSQLQSKTSQNLNPKKIK